MKNIDRLNVLLSKPNIDVPTHRRQVDSSGRNLKWLRQHIEQRNTITAELRDLLNMDQCSLSKDYIKQ